jgi:1-deoxy-D-xylulose-5-phosphate reductoisomerase
MYKKICILGSTGSIGTQSLDVLNKLRDKYIVTALTSYGTDLDLLKNQIEEFKPKIVAVADEESAYKLDNMIRNNKTEILTGIKGIIKAATMEENDMVISAISGVAGLLPTFEAIKAGKDIALANKETLVAGGKLVLNEVDKQKIKLLPVDSEHSAIFQCLEDNNKDAVKSIILTASGGPFRSLETEKLKKVTPKQALKHPNWEMGRKISIDSATLMNKGLEVIEAHWLFSIPYDDIEVVIHPQSIIHSMVRYLDGSIIAHMGVPDMRVAIQYALTYPKRVKGSVKKLDFIKTGKITFQEPRWDEFPCLKLAYEAGKAGGNLPAVLNGANEAAVRLFLNNKIGFYGIPNLIKKVMNKCNFIKEPTLKDIINSDKIARQIVEENLYNEKVGLW